MAENPIVAGTTLAVLAALAFGSEMWARAVTPADTADPSVHRGAG